MTTIQTIVGACATTALLAGCASGPNRAKEEALNQKVGIVVRPVKAGVEMRMQEAPLFEFDAAAMRPASVAILNRAAVLLKRSTRPIMIEGHTDNVGPLDYNTTLSQARANAVGDALVARGVPAARIKTKGMAYLEPVASNDTPEGRALNRRVEILVKAESEETLMGTATTK
ncbi:OmpA family protein [Caballeronia sp.]|uniref:OmpA family protein n=1 Tax=Caballeronia sp. TaxID=1931223 RepID=UPI003C6904FA